MHAHPRQNPTTMDTPKPSDVAVAKMLTAVAEVELARNYRTVRQHQFERVAGIEKEMRDIQRQYDGASTAVAVALKQAAIRQQRRDEELQRLLEQRKASKVSLSNRDLSQVKQDILADLHKLSVQQLASFEHMRFNHRRALDQISGNNPGARLRGDTAAAAAAAAAAAGDGSPGWSSSALINRHLPSRHPPRTPFRTRFSPATNTNAEISSIVSPVTEAEAGRARRAHARAHVGLTREQARVRDKWKAKIDVFKRQRANATGGSGDDRGDAAATAPGRVPGYVGGSGGSGGSGDGAGGGGDRSSDTEDSVAEDPVVVMARLRKQHKQQQQQQQHKQQRQQGGGGGHRPHHIHTARRASAPSAMLGSVLAQEAATPSFDSFLYAGESSKKAQADAQAAAARAAATAATVEANGATGGRGNTAHVTNPFESDSEGEDSEGEDEGDFVMDEAFEPVPASPEARARTQRDYGGGSARGRPPSQQHQRRRVRDDGYDSDDEGEGGGGGAGLSVDQSRAFDDRLWEIAGLGDRVPQEMRQRHSPQPQKRRPHGAGDAFEQGSEMFGGAVPNDPLLLEVEAQLRAIEGNARERETRWQQQAQFLGGDIGTPLDIHQ